MNSIYLDYNASTPLDPRVAEAFIQELNAPGGNPSNVHSHGKRCRTILENSRKKIADFFGVKSSEIIFTSGGTEGACYLLQGYHQLNPRGHIISSKGEHACVFQNLQTFEKKGTSVSYLSTGEYGAVTAAAVEAEIRSDTSLIAIIAANNETGVISPLEDIAKIALKYQIPLIVDGVAWLGKQEFSFPDGVTAAFFSGHKIYGPKGIGFCIIRQSCKIPSIFIGGEQEYNRRAGTENLPGIVALAEAIHLIAQNQSQEIEQIRNLQDRFESALQAQLKNIVINGAGPRICNTSNIAFLGIDGESLLLNLDIAGISASHGSACSSGSLQPSRVLLEMGLPYQRVNSSIRFSFGRMTTQQEIDMAIGIIVKNVKKLESLKR